MRTPTAIRLPLICLALALPASLAACGGDDDDNAGDDDQPSPDADPGAPDAGPDAMPGAYDCIGDPFPTTAPATITVGGHTNEINTQGQVPLGEVAVTANQQTGDTEIDSMTSDAAGIYSLSATTGGTPVNGYLHGVKANFKETYVYPPAPLANDQPNIPVLMVSNLVYSVLPALAQADQDADHGFLGVLVVDCFGAPVSGAQVTSNGGGTVRYVMGTSVGNAEVTQTDSSGIALIFNVNVGDTVEVDATAGGNDLAAHTVKVRADVVTTTVVAPGPIEGLQP
jgi:hypothetical protein